MLIPTWRRIFSQHRFLVLASGGLLLALLAILASDRSTVSRSAAEEPGAASATASPAVIAGDKPWNRNPPPLPDNPAFQHRKERVDIVSKAGPLFVDGSAAAGYTDWPRPKAALLLSGAQEGYIEPCGCAGLENMKGGLSRRQSLVNQLSAEGWPLLKLELGEMVRRAVPQSFIKYQSMLSGLDKMGYQAVGLGPAELRFPAIDLITAIPDSSKSPFISANVGLLAFDNEYTAPFKVFDVGGLKIGVTAVTAPEEAKSLEREDLAYVDPEAALKKVVPRLQAAKCDRLVLLYNVSSAQATAGTSAKQAAALARKFPQFDFIVTFSDRDPAPPQLGTVEGISTQIVELGHKSMFVGVIALYDDPKRPFRYQAVPLDARFPDSPPMKELMAIYQKQLQGEGLQKLGANPLPNASGAKFVGSQTCGGCHSKAFAVWEKTPHAHALQTLEKLVPPRNHDPECLSCHVTGWEPQAYQPFVSGYESMKKTPDLAGNGCENCHGPGSKHVDMENNAQGDLARRDALRKQMHMTLDDARKGINECARCHDLDNSPSFFEKGDKAVDFYWPKIEHHGKD